MDNREETNFESMRGWSDQYMSQVSIQKGVEEMANKLVAERRERYQQTRERWERFADCTL